MLTIGTISIIYPAVAAIRQDDTKILVAYSSISHRGVVIRGIFSNFIIGIEGAYILTLAHGLISPLRFIIVGGVLYDRFNTRIIQNYRGLAVYIPVLAAIFFLASCANIAVPLSIN